MPIFDYKCPFCFCKFEKLVKNATETEICIKCGQNALKVLSAPRIKLDSASGDFPSATLAWENKHPPHDPAREAARKREKNSGDNTIIVDSVSYD